MRARPVGRGIGRGAESRSPRLQRLQRRPPHAERVADVGESPPRALPRARPPRRPAVHAPMCSNMGTTVSHVLIKSSVRYTSCLLSATNASVIVGRSFFCCSTVMVPRLARGRSARRGEANESRGRNGTRTKSAGRRGGRAPPPRGASRALNGEGGKSGDFRAARALDAFEVVGACDRVTTAVCRPPPGAPRARQGAVAKKRASREATGRAKATSWEGWRMGKGRKSKMARREELGREREVEPRSGHRQLVRRHAKTSPCSHRPYLPVLSLHLCVFMC